MRTWGTGLPIDLTRRPQWLIGCVLVVVLALGVVSGCTDADYTRVTAGKLTVDRPTAWATTISVEAPWTEGFRLAPDSVNQLQVSGDFGEYATAGEAMGTLIGRAQIGLTDFTVVETRDVEIDGATSAQLVRYTISDNAGGTVSGEWIVAAHWPYPQSIAVSMLQPEFDPALEARLLESLKLKPVLR